MAASRSARGVGGGAYRAVSGKTTTRQPWALACPINRTILSRLPARSCSRAVWTTPKVSVAGVSPRAGRGATDTSQVITTGTSEARAGPRCLMTSHRRTSTLTNRPVRIRRRAVSSDADPALRPGPGPRVAGRQGQEGRPGECLEAGATDYVAKPVNSEQLLSLLRVWLYR